MKIDVVFSGGGVKAYAFIGALQSVQKRHLTIERVAGTSAGAIVASLIAANYSMDEVELMFRELDLKKFLDPPFLTNKIPFIKWLMLYFKMGLYKGDAFEKWLEEKLANKGIFTFEQIKNDYLKIIVSDISLGRLIILPDDLADVYGIDPHSFKVATAVRMSASFPYFFMPKKMKVKNKHKSYMTDGGLLSNFPLWVFQSGALQTRPVLGLTLSESLDNSEPHTIKNALDMLQALFTTMLKAHDTRYISKTKQNNIVFIPVKNIKATQLTLSEDDKNALITLGQDKTTAFLNNWP